LRFLTFKVLLKNSFAEGSYPSVKAIISLQKVYIL